MSNVLDYLNWRGDISFSQVGICEADYLTFCCLAYLPFDGIVPDGPRWTMRLGDVLSKVIELVGESGDGRTYHNKDDDKLAEALRNAPRYADLKVCAYVNIRDKAEQEQFSAITCVLPDGAIMITYRGTDDYLIAWKENLNLGFMSELPAQQDAVRYLETVSDCFDGDVYVCGHSKGGNLAMYSTQFCDSVVRARVREVRNFDGPGFNEWIKARKEQGDIAERTLTFVPQSSVVGMLLDHEEPHCVVHSNVSGLMQHIMYSWEIYRGELVRDEGLSRSSMVLDATLKNWVREMPTDKRAKLIDGFYEVIAAADAETMDELLTGRSTLSMLKARTKIDSETKEIFAEAYRLFKESLKKAIPTVRQMNGQLKEDV